LEQKERERRITKQKKFRGRGIKLFLVIQPQIKHDREKEILRSLYDSLSNLFQNVDIYIYGKKPEIDSTIIKVFAPEAKFVLSNEDTIPFYTNLARNYLIHVNIELSLKEYRLQGYQFDIIYRMAPPELEGEFIKMPPEHSFSHLPSPDQIRHETYSKTVETSSKLDVSNFRLNMEQINKFATEMPTHWIYKLVIDPKEMHYRHKSLLESMRERYEDCLKTCDEGLQHYQESPYLQYMQGRTLGDIGEYNKGIEILTRLIERHPNFADAYVERGRCKANMKDKKGAQEDFSRAKEIEPNIDLPKLLP